MLGNIMAYECNGCSVGERFDSSTAFSNALRTIATPRPKNTKYFIVVPPQTL